MLVNFKLMYEVLIKTKPEQYKLAVEASHNNVLFLETLVATAYQPQEECATALQVTADMVYGTISTVDYCTSVK